MNTVKTKPKISTAKELLQLDKEKCTLDKIEEIRNCLEAIIVEPARLGFDQQHRPVFDESEAETLKNKLFQLLHKL